MQSATRLKVHNSAWFEIVIDMTSCRCWTWNTIPSICHRALFLKVWFYCQCPAIFCQHFKVMLHGSIRSRNTIVSDGFKTAHLCSDFRECWSSWSIGNLYNSICSPTHSPKHQSDFFKTVYRKCLTFLTNDTYEWWGQFSFCEQTIWSTRNPRQFPEIKIGGRIS